MFSGNAPIINKLMNGRTDELKLCVDRQTWQKKASLYTVYYYCPVNDEAWLLGLTDHYFVLLTLPNTNYLLYGAESSFRSQPVLH